MLACIILHCIVPVYFQIFVKVNNFYLSESIMEITVNNIIIISLSDHTELSLSSHNVVTAVAVGFLSLSPSELK